ncbi:hypothetical protein QJS04_geneDACA000600 [Acorus gramineus]|uniref:Uncharacterized protein n=1 Tax=Acorus gramineus TaxID=55184 RepID=A0AAV9AP32_ACOGR|nr:hypothetical protein QJS04_geneDACA000600 [Acorus gramineus]
MATSSRSVFLPSGCMVSVTSMENSTQVTLSLNSKQVVNSFVKGLNFWQDGQLLFVESDKPYKEVAEAGRIISVLIRGLVEGYRLKMPLPDRICDQGISFSGDHGSIFYSKAYERSRNAERRRREGRIIDLGVDHRNLLNPSYIEEYETLEDVLNNNLEKYLIKYGKEPESEYSDITYPMKRIMNIEDLLSHTALFSSEEKFSLMGEIAKRVNYLPGYRAFMDSVSLGHHHWTTKVNQGVYMKMSRHSHSHYNDSLSSLILFVRNCVERIQSDSAIEAFVKPFDKISLSPGNKHDAIKHKDALINQFLDEIGCNSNADEANELINFLEAKRARLRESRGSSSRGTTG